MRSSQFDSLPSLTTTIDASRRCTLDGARFTNARECGVHGAFLNREAERRRQAKLRTGSDRGWGLSIKAWTAFNLHSRLTARGTEPNEPRCVFIYRYILNEFC